MLCARAEGDLALWIRRGGDWRGARSTIPLSVHDMLTPGTQLLSVARSFAGLRAQCSGRDALDRYTAAVVRVRSAPGAPGQAEELV